MKKILILANNDIWLYKLRKELIRALLDQGHEVYISSPKGETIGTMESWGCKFVETIVDRRGTNPLNDLKLIGQYFHLLRKVKPDVVLTYTIKPNLYGGLVCRFLDIPCINNITGLGSGFSKNPILISFLSLMYRIGLKKSHCVFFQNTEDMKALIDRKIIKGRYELIPGSGVNLSEYKFKEFPASDSPTFIFIGRIMKDKGIDQYLEAAKVIKGKYPNTKFNIIGFIENTQPEYKELIRQYQSEGYINYLGFQTDVKPFIEEAHCIIQPSHGGEGLSNVLLETAASGRALIASNIPGCRETITEGKNGYIFEAKNTKSLIQKIEQFINLSHSEKITMGKNSREKIEKEFDRNIVVQAYVKKISGI